jgi:hypothetical protein
LVGARRYDVESSVLSGCPDIQVTRHRELLAFAVFGHLREEACELDEIAGYFVLFEYFAHIDISEVFARDFVFEFEVFGRHVADFVAVRCDVNFKDVLAIIESSVAYVNGNTTETLVQNLIVNSRRIYGDT